MLSSDDLGLLLRAVITTALVLGALLYLARLAKRGKLDGLLSKYGAGRVRPDKARPAAKTDSVQLRQRIAVGRDQQLLCIEWHGEELLLAVSSSSATLVARHPKADSVDTENTISDSTVALRDAAGGVDDFAATLQRIQDSEPSWLDRVREATVRKDTGK